MLVLCPWAMGAEGCSQVNSVQSGVQVGSKPTMSSVRVGVRKQGVDSAPGSRSPAVEMLSRF